jgi:hypothetical protein
MNWLPDPATVTSALDALKSIKSISEAMVSLRSGPAFDQKKLELERSILDARSGILAIQEQRLAILGEIDDLKKQVASMETWATEKARYELKNVDAGATVRALKPSMQGDDPPHWLCPNCYEGGKKSILQNSGPATERGAEHFNNIWRCKPCGCAVRTNHSVNPESFAAKEAQNV